MRKGLFVITTILGVWYLFTYGTDSELIDFNFFLKPYIFMLIGMYVLRVLNIEFTWIKTNFKVLLWSIPIFLFYIFWCYLVVTFLIIAIAIFVLYAVLNESSSNTVEGVGTNSNSVNNDAYAWEMKRQEHNKRMDEEIRRAKAQGYYRKAVSYEREKY